LSVGFDPALEKYHYSAMSYVYILKMRNNQIYIGLAKDLRERLERHKNGEVFTTSKYLPVKLVYFECYLSEKDAVQREKMLKRYGSGLVHLKRRISYSLGHF
jgi:putative endonuclease